ncbi:Serine-rich coiled-coil domain-containing protein 1 [Frankliniella fusca]|uniref:Serine-rich coiled-coil domain-containing protein 1 n=1 Tax=Frankliniella fusca TaxID=407009 RepID=A0AAE1GYY8_9NEOP|nr:Serine-rich coiled-coil domain-containing protein 1 [Frankliniella fusca]
MPIKVAHSQEIQVGGAVRALRRGGSQAEGSPSLGRDNTLRLARYGSMDSLATNSIGSEDLMMDFEDDAESGRKVRAVTGSWTGSPVATVKKSRSLSFVESDLEQELQGGAEDSPALARGGWRPAREAAEALRARARSKSDGGEAEDAAGDLDGLLRAAGVADEDGADNLQADNDSVLLELSSLIESISGKERTKDRMRPVSCESVQFGVHACQPNPSRAVASRAARARRAPCRRPGHGAMKEPLVAAGGDAGPGPGSAALAVPAGDPDPKAPVMAGARAGAGVGVAAEAPPACASNGRCGPTTPTAAPRLSMSPSRLTRTPESLLTPAAAHLNGDGAAASGGSDYASKRSSLLARQVQPRALSQVQLYGGGGGGGGGGGSSGPSSAPDSPRYSLGSSGVPSPLRPPRQLASSDSDESAMMRVDRGTYQHMYQDVVHIKTMLLKLKRVLQEAETLNPFESSLKNGLLHQLVHADESGDDDGKARNPGEEVVDLKRQMVLMKQQMEEKDRTIQLMQLQMMKYERVSEDSGENGQPADMCNAATQTERIRPVSAGPSLLQSLPADANGAPLVSWTDTWGRRSRTPASGGNGSPVIESRTSSTSRVPTITSRNSRSIGPSRLGVGTSGDTPSSIPLVKGNHRKTGTTIETVPNTRRPPVVAAPRKAISSLNQKP